MQIILVNSPQTERDFLLLPLDIYKNNPKWIRPLDKDLKSVFSPQKNAVAHKDNFMRWLLLDDNQKIIGRIAAFVNEKTKLKNNDYPVGDIGFFECIDDQKCVEAMEGPINFGDRDKFWGLLTQGFEEEPNYLANYNPEYYVALFENYGFKLYFNQFTFSRKIDVDFPESYYNRGMGILNNPDYYFTGLKKNNLDKYTEDFRVVYNKAWVKHEGVAEMKSKQAKAIIKQLKPILDENTAFFGYYKDEPIAFFINIPEVNQIFKYVNGKLNWWGKLIFLKHKLLKKNHKLLGIGFGVIPEYDGKGVTQALAIFAGNKLTQKTNFRVIEMHGVGDFNPGMLKFVDKMGKSEKNKIHTTYRYVFDRERPYERMPLKSNSR